jgi:predicted enzyme related to lactoylglutathione lyase
MQILLNVDVDDLDKATRFYKRAFELRVGRRLGNDGIEMLGSSAPICLLLKAAGTSATGANSHRRSHDRDWTPVHLDFVVEEIESAVRRAVDTGARLESPVTTHKWGLLALMSDPFGNRFCFV